MKKLIWFTKYNTDTSEFLAGFETGGTSILEETYVWRAVYLAPDGKFFEYTVGGTATPYRSMEYGFPNIGYHMRLLSREGAIEWFETNAFFLEYREREHLLSEIRLSSWKRYEPPFDIKPPKDWLGF